MTIEYANADHEQPTHTQLVRELQETSAAIEALAADSNLDAVDTALMHSAKSILSVMQRIDAILDALEAGPCRGIGSVEYANADHEPIVPDWDQDSPVDQLVQTTAKRLSDAGLYVRCIDHGGYWQIWCGRTDADQLGDDIVITRAGISIRDHDGKVLDTFDLGDLDGITKRIIFRQLADQIAAKLRDAGADIEVKQHGDEIFIEPSANIDAGSGPYIKIDTSAPELYLLDDSKPGPYTDDTDPHDPDWETINGWVRYIAAAQDRQEDTSGNSTDQIEHEATIAAATLVLLTENKPVEPLPNTPQSILDDLDLDEQGRIKLCGYNVLNLSGYEKANAARYTVDDMVTRWTTHLAAERVNDLRTKEDSGPEWDFHNRLVDAFVERGFGSDQFTYQLDDPTGCYETVIAPEVSGDAGPTHVIYRESGLEVHRYLDDQQPTRLPGSYSGVSEVMNGVMAPIFE